MRKIIVYAIVPLTALFALFVFGGIYLVITDSYPVAFIGWQWLSHESYAANAAAALNYYEKFNKTYGTAQGSDDAQARRNLERGALEKLIEDRLVENELRRRINASDLESIVASKVESVLKGAEPGLEQQVRTIYGLSLGDFKKFILVPQAKRDILEGRLLLDNNVKSLEAAGDVLSAWLETAKAQANIVLLIPGYHWDGKGIVVK